MGDERDIPNLEKASEGFWARINHPVFGTFISSAIVWNWEIIYFIFRGLGDPIYTAGFVNSQYLTWANWKNLFGWPALLTLAFLGFSPALHEGYTLYKRWWRVFARRGKPIPNFIYEKTYSKLEMEKESLRGDIKKLQKEKKDAEGQFQNKEKESSEKFEKLKAKFDLSQGKPVYLPGVGRYDPGPFVDQFMSNRSELENSKEEIKQLKRLIGSKETEISTLKKRIIELE